jgi:hypothetical protein
MKVISLRLALVSVVSGLAVLLAVWAVTTRSTSADVPENAWICSAMLQVLQQDRPAMEAATPEPGVDAHQFSLTKAAGLADVDKGLLWAQRGCNLDEDGGDLVPALYQSALRNGTMVAVPDGG